MNGGRILKDNSTNIAGQGLAQNIDDFEGKVLEMGQNLPKLNTALS